MSVSSVVVGQLPMFELALEIEVAREMVVDDDDPEADFFERRVERDLQPMDDFFEERLRLFWNCCISN